MSLHCYLIWTFLIVQLLISHKENLNFYHFTQIQIIFGCVWTQEWSSQWTVLKDVLLSTESDLVLLLLDGLCSAQSACTTGSNETDLATSRCIPPDCWGFADVLMVTTTEGMFNRLQGKKASLVWGPSKGTRALLSSPPLANVHNLYLQQAQSASQLQESRTNNPPFDNIFIQYSRLFFFLVKKKNKQANAEIHPPTDTLQWVKKHLQTCLETH